MGSCKPNQHSPLVGKRYSTQGCGIIRTEASGNGGDDTSNSVGRRLPCGIASGRSPATPNFRVKAFEHRFHVADKCVDLPVSTPWMPYPVVEQVHEFEDGTGKPLSIVMSDTANRFSIGSLCGATACVVFRGSTNGTVIIVNSRIERSELVAHFSFTAHQFPSRFLVLSIGTGDGDSLADGVNGIVAEQGRMHDVTRGKLTHCGRRLVKVAGGCASLGLARQIVDFAMQCKPPLPERIVRFNQATQLGCIHEIRMRLLERFEPFQRESRRHFVVSGELFMRLDSKSVGGLPDFVRRDRIRLDSAARVGIDSMRRELWGRL